MVIDNPCDNSNLHYADACDLYQRIWEILLVLLDSSLIAVAECILLRLLMITIGLSSLFNINLGRPQR